MAMDSDHAQARRRLYADRRRHERYITRVSEHLHKSREEAIEWIDQMFTENRSDLVDVVSEGALVEDGRVYFPGEAPAQ